MKVRGNMHKQVNIKLKRVITYANMRKPFKNAQKHGKDNITCIIIYKISLKIHKHIKSMYKMIKHPTKGIQ